MWAAFPTVFMAENILHISTFLIKIYNFLNTRLIDYQIEMTQEAEEPLLNTSTSSFDDSFANSITGSQEEQEDTPQDRTFITPKTRGWVNEHFKKIIVAGKQMRMCLADGCGKRYAAGSSHQVFKKHWLDHSPNTVLKKTRFMFHDQLDTNRLIKLFIAAHLQYWVVGMDEFKAYVESLDPNKKPISRHKLSELINTSRNRLTHEVCKKLSNAESVALTFDIWSARKGWRGFGCVTAHYINTFGKMENIILHFKRMKFPHDAKTIKKFIEKPIRMFRLEGRVVSITTDNASNNLAAFALMDKSIGLTSLGFDLIHYRCVAHIFDLGMRDAMKQLKELVAPVREAVMAIHSSKKRKEKFEEKQKELIAEGRLKTASKQPLELIEDVEHRWNSLFALLDRAFLLHEALDFMIDTTRGLETILHIDWELTSTVIKFLEPFNEATKHLCQANGVNISLVAYITPKLVDHCADYEASECEWIAAAATSMHERLRNYELGIYHNIAEVAFFLDPRFITKGLSEPHCELIMENMKKLLDRTSLPESESQRPASSSILGLDVDLSGQVDELTNYMVFGKHLGLVPMSTDVLDWWQTNSKQFPKLASLARKILPVQGTSVASERVFSVAGDIDSRKRNRLCDDSVENIVLFKSWMKYLNVE